MEAKFGAYAVTFAKSGVLEKEVRPNSRAGGDGTDSLSASSIATNLAFNLGGEGVVVVLGIICIPYVVSRLGADSFGVLSLSWVLLSYMTLFDLGLSRATTKFAAEAIGTGDHRQLPSLLGTSLSLQFALGLIGGSLLFGSSSWLAGKLFKMPGPLVIQAAAGFKILAFAVPVVLITNCLRGMLEALQRFDLVNYVKVPTNASMFLSPILILPFGGRLPSIIMLMMAFRCASMFAYLILCFSVLPKPGLQFVSEPNVLSKLLKYGGWVTISNATGPILMYADRFAIGILMSIGAVAYYTAPTDMIGRALVIPASLGSILFPAFSSLGAASAQDRLEDLYARSVKYLIIGLGPVLLLAAVFSRDILHLWLGATFAEKSTLPLQITTVGVFVTSLAYFPFILLQGLGKPKLTGVFHLVEVPLHLMLVWILVTRMGIVGAAIASTARVVIDAILLFWACWWFRLTSSRALFNQHLIRSLASLAAFSIAVWICAVTGKVLLLRIAIAVAFLVCYAFAQWHWSIDHRDREFLKAMNRRTVESFKKSSVAAGIQ
jgi:O-antigen/teichoic acid export membrane protein